MAKIQMGHSSTRVLTFLAEAGAQSVGDILQKFPAENEKNLRQRLRNLEYSWWVERDINNQRTLWRIHRDAWRKLPEIGIKTTAAALPQRRSRPRDVPQTPPQNAAPPRRYNIFAAPVWSPPPSTGPSRPGALDFLSCPSRGVSC